MSHNFSLRQKWLYFSVIVLFYDYLVMNKKEFLMSILSTLSQDWPYADGLKLVIEQSDIDTTVIDGLYEILSHALQEAQEQSKKASLTKWIEALKKLKEIENNEKWANEQELEDIISQL